MAFFNLSIGVERLMKVLLLLDHWRRDRRFPDDKTLKQYGGKYGHDLLELGEHVEKLLLNYSVVRPREFEPDEIDCQLLKFLADFAKSSRYFNLDTLTGGANAPDPLGVWDGILRKVYETDVPELKRKSNEDQVDAFVEMIESHTVFVPTVSMRGRPQSHREFCQDHGKMALVLPEICWRFVKMLIPSKDLLITLRERIHEEDLRIGVEPSVPYMEKFLDFVCRDKMVVLGSKDWL